MSPQGAFVELTGDRQAESRTEKSYSSCTLPGVINAFVPWEPKKYPSKSFMPTQQALT